MDDDVFFRLFYFKVICFVGRRRPPFLLPPLEVSFVFCVSLLTLFDHPLLITRSALFFWHHTKHTHLFIVKPNIIMVSNNNNNQLCASFCFRSLSLSLSFFFLSDVFVLLAEERGGVRFYRGRLLFGMDVSFFSKRRCGL